MNINIRISAFLLVCVLMTFNSLAQECNSDDVGNPAWRGGGSQGGNRTALVPKDDQCSEPIESYWASVNINVDMPDNENCHNSIVFVCADVPHYSYSRFYNASSAGFLDRTFSLDMNALLLGQPEEKAVTIYRHWVVDEVNGQVGSEFALLTIKFKKSSCSRRTNNCDWRVLVDWSQSAGVAGSQIYDLPAGITDWVNFDVIANPVRNELGDVVAQHYYLQIYNETINHVMDHPNYVSADIGFIHADIGYIHSEDTPVDGDLLRMRQYIEKEPLD